MVNNPELIHVHIQALRCVHLCINQFSDTCIIQHPGMCGYQHTHTGTPVLTNKSSHMYVTAFTHMHTPVLTCRNQYSGIRTLVYTPTVTDMYKPAITSVHIQALR